MSEKCDQRDCPYNGEAMDMRLRAIEGKVDALLTILQGAAGEASHGVIVRLDRLEQRSKWTWAAVGLAVTAVIDAVAGHIWK